MRKTRHPQSPERRERLAFPALVVLVSGAVALGTWHYFLPLAVGAAILAGVSAWLWRRTLTTPHPARARKKLRR